MPRRREQALERPGAALSVAELRDGDEDGGLRGAAGGGGRRGERAVDGDGGHVLEGVAVEDAAVFPVDRGGAHAGRLFCSQALMLMLVCSW